MPAQGASTQKFDAKEIKGYSPAVDIKDDDQAQYVISGTNYNWDSRGPKSGYGDRLLEPNGLGVCPFFQGHRLKVLGQKFTIYITNQAIWLWNEQQGTYSLAYVLDDTVQDQPYRWTFGYLDSKVYMCHPKPGILVLDLDTQLVMQHSQLSNVAVLNAMAIAVNNGRLCVMTDTQFVWSNAADGLDFAPQLGGAGFQVIAERVPGVSIMMTSYASGCLIWTQGGVLNCGFTADQTVFRFRTMSTDIRPANSFCVITIDNDITIILDERGLFQFSGNVLYQSTNSAPTPYDPVMNEYLIEYIRDNALAVSITMNRLRLEWDDMERQLFVSICGQTVEGGYTEALVYYTSLQKWSQFSEFHYGVAPVDINYGTRIGSYTGYADFTGRVRFWTGGTSREADPDSNGQSLLNLYTVPTNIAVQYDKLLTGRIMSTSIAAYGFSPAAIVNASAVAIGRTGFYLSGASTPAPKVKEALNSTIQIGTFRPAGPTSVDEMSEVLNVLIRSLETVDDTILNEDFELEIGGEDLETETGSEDYGTGVPESVGMGLNVIGTLDGSNSYMTQAPYLVDLVQGAKYYSCSVNGVWHILEVTALELGESFHIVGGEITAASSGRLL
jgi:hypothetical protein